MIFLKILTYFLNSKNISKFNGFSHLQKLKLIKLINKLQSGDYRRGFLQSLSQLTNVGEISEVQFLSEF
jgi:hypothetical protein